MSERMKEFIVGIIATLVFTVAMGGCLYHSTSAEAWYAGMHDGECENTLHGEKCRCYERFLEREKDK